MQKALNHAQVQLRYWQSVVNSGSIGVQRAQVALTNAQELLNHELDQCAEAPDKVVYFSAKCVRLEKKVLQAKHRTKINKLAKLRAKIGGIS